MAFPQVVRTSTSHVGSVEMGSSSHPISLPAGITAGNLLLVFFSCGTANVTISVDTTVSGNDWSQFVATSSANHTATIFYKADATGSDALTLNLNSAQRSTAISYEISNFSNTINNYCILSYASSTGLSANMNPPSLSSNMSTSDLLWIVFGSTDDDIIASAAPTYFSNLLTVSGESEGASCSSATREINMGATSYDPGPFTTNSASWITYTVIVYPKQEFGFGFNIAYYGI